MLCTIDVCVLSSPIAFMHFFVYYDPFFQITSKLCSYFFVFRVFAGFHVFALLLLFLFLFRGLFLDSFSIFVHSIDNCAIKNKVLWPDTFLNLGTL